VTLFEALSRQRRFVYLVVGLLSAAGIWATLRLPSAIYPELQFSRITVVAQGSTLGARQIVFSVTRPLEEAVSIVPGVMRVRSHTIRGATEISVTFAPGTNMDLALQLVRARVNQIQSNLPSDVALEIEQLTPSLFPILSYNVEGGEPATLYDIARYDIKPELRQALLADDVGTLAPLVNAYLLRFYFQIRGMPEAEFIARLHALKAQQEKSGNEREPSKESYAHG